MVMLRKPDERGGFEEIKKHPWLADIDWKKAAVGALQPPYVPVSV